MPSPDSHRSQPQRSSWNNSPPHHPPVLIPIPNQIIRPPSSSTSSSSHELRLSLNHSDLEPYSDSSPQRPILRQTTQQNQRDQDVQAALHFSRARSGTLASIHNQSHSQPEPAWPAHHDLLSGPPTLPSTPAHLSPTHARTAPPSGDSQRDQDVHFFASPVPLGHSPPTHSPGLPASHPLLLDLAPDERLSARLRRGSDHSQDSAHGAFIDHRTPPLPAPHPLPASAPLASRHAHRHSLQHSPTYLRPSLSASAGPSTHLSAFGQPLGSPPEPSRDTDPSYSLSTRTARGPHLFGPGRREPDCASTLCSPPRQSDAEADVCFPRLEAGRDGSPPRIDAPRRGLAGMLPHFPFPFDFGALEEFKEKERELLLEGAGSGGVGGGGGGGDGGDCERGTGRSKGVGGEQVAWDGCEEEDMTGVAEEEEPRDGVRRRRIGFLGAPEERAAGRLGILKQRRLSESVGQAGSRQRKLALFEGASGGSEAAGGGGGGGGGLKGALEARAPLLGKLARATAAGPAQRDRAGQVRWGAGERPYRFSFYSNALPSTIHARSLGEIPSEGQTFEELFVGHSVATGGVSEDVSDAGPVPGSVPSRPEGLLGTSHLGRGGQENGNGNNGKPRSGVLMRTDEDAEANTWWLDVLCPTDQEMKLLSKVFGIHPLTTEDIQMEETREKIELFRNYYLVCFRSFDQDVYSPTYLEPLNMYIVVFREGTLSFHFRGTPHPQNVRRRIKQLKDYINVTSDWISYALIDDITDAFGPLIKSIEYEVDSIDELVLILKEAEQSDMLRRIGTCRKKVMGLLRLMGNKADVVKGLSKRCNENWSVAPKSDIGLYLSDIQDHLVTMTQNLNHYEKILSRSHSNYLAQISIEMTDANNQINDVLSKLTALGSILVPMNLVTGLWGMNVHVPGQDTSEGYAWFISIVCGLVSFGVIGAWVTLRYFKFSNS